MERVKHYGDNVAMITRRSKNNFFWQNLKTGSGVWGETAVDVAKKTGLMKYCVDVEHVCEGPGCGVKTRYQYCPYCNFENRRADDPPIGILGM